MNVEPRSLADLAVAHAGASRVERVVPAARRRARRAGRRAHQRHGERARGPRPQPREAGPKNRTSLQASRWRLRSASSCPPGARGGHRAHTVTPCLDGPPGGVDLGRRQNHARAASTASMPGASTPEPCSRYNASVR